MDVFDEEILELWRTLKKHNIRYIMVGGFATNLHGFMRTTADIDIWIQDTPGNRKKFRTALQEIGLGDLKEIETMQFIPGWSSIHLKSGFELDIMAYIAGFTENDFDECYNAAAIATIHNVEVRFLQLNHLIKTKEAAGRAKDIIDVEELKKLNNK